VIGSFTVGDTTITVSTDYSHIDGRVYKLTDAKTQEQVAVTSYRGMDLAAGVQYSKAELQRGLESVRRKTRR